MELDLSSELQINFGFTEFRPGQEEAIKALLAGKHTLVVMPTGSGKSLIYQLAAMQLSGIVLVISPLIALMKDQVDQLQKRQIPATFVNSSLPKGEQFQRLKEVQKGLYRIIYVAPERLRSSSFRESMAKVKIDLLAVDEAHCISEWGHDFRPDYLTIADSRIAFGEPLTAALTATATPKVQADILRLLKIDQAEKIVTGFNRPNLALEVCYTTDISEKLKCVQRLMASMNEDGATIIYTGTRREAEETAEFLRQVCCQEARFYHAGLASQERDQVQESFISGQCSLVVATNAFGMGIDRADVRQVIHFNLPGSLEAYYQEAGRAGRDGLPAVATLIYDPKDQALHEYFIKTNSLSYQHLKTVYQALPDEHSKSRWLSNDDLSILTGLTEVQIRLGLSLLEKVEALARWGDEGLVMQLEKRTWDEEKIQAALSKVSAFQNAKRKQLEQIIRYAESNQCRRRILLDHFGDRGPAEAQDCCDNCRTRKLGLQSGSIHLIDAGHSDQSVSGTDQQKSNVSQSENKNLRISLVILDAVRRLKYKVGKERLAQILHGSQAQKVINSKLDQHIYYGRLDYLRQSEILDLIDQLVQAGYFKIIGGQYPVVQLSAQGEIAIQHKQEIPLNLPKRLQITGEPSGSFLKKGENTIAITETLFAQGHSPEQIANIRGLNPRTIYTHLARLIGAGKVDLEQLVSNQNKENIEEAIQKAGQVEYLKPIKDLLPQDISYEEIRCVVENWKRQRGHDYSRSASEVSVEEFLTMSHPRQLPGPWQSGWSLGFHSGFSGSGWQRSQVGEWTYRLKYKEDLSVLSNLVEQVLALCKEHPELIQVDRILPVPPSQSRPNDPVRSFALVLGQKARIPVSDGLVKARQTEQQKTLTTLAQKKVNVAGAFALTTSVEGLRILLVDDLFDSGATLNEIHRVVQKAGAASINVLALTRTIHSEK